MGPRIEQFELAMGLLSKCLDTGAWWIPGALFLGVHNAITYTFSVDQTQFCGASRREIKDKYQCSGSYKLQP